MIDVEVTNRQRILAVDEPLLADAVRRVLSGEGISAGTISLAIIDDAQIQRLNRQYLDHDHATDVLSFLLEKEAQRIEGEIIASAETAAREAPRFGWPPASEMLLYVVHGALHLAGYDDATRDQAAEMRRRESHWLDQLGALPVRSGEPDPVTTRLA